MPVYDPTSPASLFYYFDAADPSTLKGAGGAPIADGADVYEWLNKGTSSARFVPISGVGRPTWHASGPSGRPALRFNGASGLTLDDVAGLTSLSGLTMGAVASVDATPPTGQQAIFKIHAATVPAGNRAIIAIFESRIRTGGRRLDADAGQWWQDGPVSPGERFIATTTYDYDNAKIRAYKNGVLWSEDVFQTPGPSAAGNPAHVSIGLENRPGDTGQTNYLTGWIEVIAAVRSAPSPDGLVPLHHYLRIAKGIG